MRKIFYISILTLALKGIVNAQITGQLFQSESEFPLAKVALLGESQYVESDFDGNFAIEISNNLENVDLVIDLNQVITDSTFRALKIIIKDLKFDDRTKLELGKIELPAFKSIEVSEFERLSKSEQENCYPIYCWTQLLGYSFTNELENEYLILNCEDRITEFEYNPATKIVKIEWDVIKDCK